MRRERRIDAEECDTEGRYRLDMAPMLTWGPEPLDRRSEGDLQHEASTGELMGWAVMETRIAVGRRPSVGDRIQSFAAPVALFDKVIHRISWVYDLDAGDLLTVFDSVNMAFDVRGRRPMSIPEGYRRAEEARLQPDLDPLAMRAAG
jgi:hypothetical protein